ncbi:chromate efflux transporter [Brevundimonas sp.]|uniref:chromate efflux transporter n=1 Tax=Brevundimonas sp. TaxID=1871086 RepID=UPI0025E6EF5F|nr:chromate efflux transporter [Brevundimonas sp.]
MTQEATTSREPQPPRLSYAGLFLRFLRFGLLAFGGPVAQIAMIKHELVERERWISPQRFNRLLAVMQVLPGPEAHELCVHLGMRAKGRLGGVLAGLGFMLPGLLLMLLLSWLYFRIDFERGWVGAALLGVQAAVLGLIVRAVPRIGSHVLTDRWLWVIAGVSGLAALLGVSFWLALPAGGIVYALVKARRPGFAVLAAALALAAALWLGLQAPPPTAPEFVARVVTEPGDVAWPWLLLAGLKAGLLTFGGAYTAIPFLREDAVRQGWTGDGQFLDGLALSGVLPAPLIIFATFVGYVAGGFPGALAITAGIFLPAFAFSLIFYDRLEAVLENARLHALLEGVAAAVVGLIAATALQLTWGLLAGNEDRLVLAAVLLAALAVIWRWKARIATPVVLIAAGCVGAALLA